MQFKNSKSYKISREVKKSKKKSVKFINLLNLQFNRKLTYQKSPKNLVKFRIFENSNNLRSRRFFKRTQKSRKSKEYKII